MSVSLWAYRTSSDAVQHLIGKRDACSGEVFNWQIAFDGNNIGFGTGNSGDSALAPMTLPMNVWTHLVGTYDGGSFRLYVNGSLAGEDAGTLGPANDAPLVIGGSHTCQPFGGLLDEVQLHARAVTAAEVFSMYTAHTCYGSETGRVSCWKAENNALDATDGNDGKLDGGTYFTDGIVGQAFRLDGTDDGIEIGNPDNLRLQSFSISAWIRRTSEDAATLSEPDPGGDIFLYGKNGYAFGIFDDGTVFLSKTEVDAVTSGSLKVADTDWHHVAVTRSGTATLMYVDGIAGPMQSYDTQFEFTTNASIGRRDDTGGNSLYGSIDELQVWNRALTAPEVQSLALLGCGDANRSGTINATDSLLVLRSAVGGIQCNLAPCICDPNASGSITATDALAVLRKSVGQDIPMNCPCPG
jgi:hypothetical protein